MTIKLTEEYPDTMSSILVSYWTGYSRLSSHKDILVVKYSGKYGFGSSGNSDAKFMYAKGCFGLAAIEPLGVLIDLSELEYEWGDMLDLVFDIGRTQYINEPFPTALIVGEKCSNAIGTLIHGEKSSKPAIAEEWIFNEFDKAWEYLEKQIET